jgi:peptide/nickel transport system substrate-binding protein
MKAKKLLALLLTAAMLLSSLAACGTAADETETETDTSEAGEDATLSGQTLTYDDAKDSVFSLSLDYDSTLNPLKTTSTLNQMVDCLVYDRLFEVDENFNVTSRILSDWYYTKNEGSSGVWVLTVKEGIQMHDGSTLTASDVAYSVSSIFTTGSSYYQQQVGRVYASSYNGDVYLATEGADDSLLPARLSIPVIKYGTAGDDIPVGSGAYTFNDDHTALVKFDGYENSDLLPVDEIDLRAYRGMEELITEFENGLVDLVTNDPTGIYNMGYGGKNETRTITTSNLHFIGFNSNSEFFGYETYRYAMNWIVDRDTIVNDTLDGNAVATMLPIHPNSSLYDASIVSQFSYSPEKCAEEFQRGGARDLDDDGYIEFAVSGSKVDMEINFIVCADNASKVQEARVIAESMESIGLKVNLRELTWSEYNEALETGYLDEDEEIPVDMYLAEVALGGDWNILTLISGDVEDDGTLNYGGWDDEEVTSLTETFLGAKDEDRAAAETAWLTALTARTFFIPMCFETREVLSHLGTISGMSPNQYDIFNDITSWTIDVG